MEGIKILRAKSPISGHGLRLAPQLEELIHELDVEMHRVVKQRGFEPDYSMWGYSHKNPDVVNKIQLTRRWGGRERALVATLNGVPIGLLMYRRGIKQKHLHITEFVVTEAHRNKGVGRKLMNKIVSESKALGVNKMTLHVYNGNCSAENLYRDYGFQPRYSQLEASL